MYQPALEAADPEWLRARQLQRLNALLRAVLPRNRFYARKLAGLTPPIDWDAFAALPLTTKDELVADQAAEPPLGTIATFAAERYLAFHQTSGTTGHPMRILDTRESWHWWAECWQYVYHAADVSPADRIFLAFSFGPFIGFWSAHAGARQLGAMSIPSGGLDSAARLRMMQSTGATVLMSTPTYALRLAEVARDEGVALTELAIRTTIHAGEPGGSIPAVRARIERAWNARCFDHAGATEVGAYGFTCAARQGLHLNEAEFIAEVLDPATGRATEAGQIGELVLTNLGRVGWPVLRYRTGDLVRVGPRQCECGRTFLRVPGGLIGRADDLMVVRGINVYPSAVEAIVRDFDVDEFRIVRTRRQELDEILVEVESASPLERPLAEALRQRLGIRVATRQVPPGSLPRFDLKARRVVDRRGDTEPDG